MGILPPMGATIAKMPAPVEPEMVCELPGCESTFTVHDSYSFVTVTFATRGGKLNAFQCADKQHFGCCREHAALLAVACINEHMLPVDAEQARIVSSDRHAEIRADIRARAAPQPKKKAKNGK